VGAPGGRSAEILERLARQQPRRTLFRRAPTPFDADLDPAPDDTLRVQRPPRAVPTRRAVVAVAVVLCAVAVAAALLLDRRPPPIEQRLPLASEEPASEEPASAASATQRSDSPGGGAAEAAGDAQEAEEAAADDGDGTPQVFVHVAGAVSAPGVVELPGGSRVVDAVRSAGGLRADADPDRVNLAAELVDGQRIVIPAKGQEVPAEVLPTGPTAEQLDALPGVGPATAAAILSHREQHGPFGSVEDLIDVRGIGEAKLEGLRDLVTVGGA
jgi:competence protein ComEA